MSMTSETPSPRPEAEDDDEIDLLALAGRLWAGRWLIGLCAALAIAGGAFEVATTPYSYQADGLIQLEVKNATLSLPPGLGDLSGNAPESATEIAILRSRLVIGAAVAELHLDRVAHPQLMPVIGVAVARYGLPLPPLGALTAYARKGDAISLDLLQVPPAWVGTPMTLVYDDATDYHITLPDGQVLPGRTGQTLSNVDKGFALRVDSISGAPGRQYSVTQISEGKAISALLNHLSVSEKGKGSGILKALYTGPSPAEAARVLQAVIAAYRDQNVLRSSAEAKSGLDFINQQLPDAEKKFTDAEKALNDYRQQQQAIDLSFEAQSLLTQIADQENQLNQLAQKEDEIKQRYTPNHPVYQQLLADRQRVKDRLAELRKQVSDLPQTQRDVINLTSALDLAQKNYTALLARSQELQVLQASTIGNVRIIDGARAAPAPVSPRKARILAIWLLLGLIVGAGIVLLRAALRRAIDGPDSLERAGLPVFATIQYVPGMDDGTGRRRGEVPKLLAISEPTSLAVEGFRSLRTSLHFGMLDARTKAVLITSPAPNAGKSFCSVNLAVVAAEAGQATCLIDADMRRGSLRRYVGAKKNRPGLSDYLAGNAKLDDILVDGPVAGLKVICTGRYPPNPSELLMRESLSRLLAELDARFDLTIVDSPPPLAVTDPVILGRAIGTTILVARHDQTTLAEVEAARRTLGQAGVTLAGAILNSFDPRKAAYGYGTRYGYGYRYAYKAGK